MSAAVPSLNVVFIGVGAVSVLFAQITRMSIMVGKKFLSPKDRKGE